MKLPPRGTDEIYPSTEAIALSSAIETGDVDLVSSTFTSGSKIDDWVIRSAVFHDPPPLAIVLKERELTTWFLEHGADPNAGPNDHATVLSAAVVYEPPETVFMLLENGGDIAQGQLLHAVLERQYGNDEERDELLITLIQRGAPLHEFECLMHWDARIELWACGTPLHKAIHMRQPDSVRILLSHGADPQAKDSYGRTPAGVAIEKKRDACLAVIKSFGTAQSHL
ncbi:MAG: hypothetical protein M1828_002112 [Chrysothrix sp. TS-e1954]|nr:MAG: hypothetical protein M1828_002112 [Chrysothrix sp. TS-e1954]